MVVLFLRMMLLLPLLDKPPLLMGTGGGLFLILVLRGRVGGHFLVLVLRACVCYKSSEPIR